MAWGVGDQSSPGSEMKGTLPVRGYAKSTNLSTERAIGRATRLEVRSDKKATKERKNKSQTYPKSWNLARYARDGVLNAGSQVKERRPGSKRVSAVVRRALPQCESQPEVQLAHDARDMVTSRCRVE
ncbi:unnamed protein product [Clonostachys chloroleuca]|uniref:Uncharacterized protein n=1 Tax=Clonostachys chloroleuca TaxID=1926264 RepID=A0AA35MDM5_9HYPO|nr:unnamed protein product [Clonostachys chloroleuca]